jgi:hypothetical protein
MSETFDGLPTRFPGLREIESRILARFARDMAPAGKWTINLRFPYPEDQISPGLSENERKAVAWNKSKRIEGLLETSAEIWLVEVKERVVPSALGELLMYEGLYRKHFSTVKPLVKVLVALEDDVLLRPALAQAGVRVFILGQF